MAASTVPRDLLLLVVALLTVLKGQCQGRMCLDCRSVSALKFCNNVVTCNQTEVCYVSRRHLNSGETTFSAGCIKPDINVCGHIASGRALLSPQRRQSDPCRECCDSDFCNAAGCGDPGFPSKASRGPVCLDCHHFGNFDQCRQLTLCQSSELCSIEAYSWGDSGFLYTVGCQDQLMCLLGTRSGVIAGRRSVPVCQACCHDDFCNRNCSQSYVPSVIDTKPFHCQKIDVCN